MSAPDSLLYGAALTACVLLASAAIAVSVLLARHLGQLRHQLAETRDMLLTRVADAARQRGDAQRLEVFVRAVESLEQGTRVLVTYSQLTAEHATSVVFDGEGVGFRQSAAEFAALRAPAEQSGLFLPPELDRPFQRVLKAILAVQVAAAVAADLTSRDERKELCRPAVLTMDQELLTFLNTSRVWKKRNWFLATTGEEASPDAFTDATSPALTRPANLLRDDGPVGH